MRDDDDDLRSAFATLREEEAGSLPDFAAMRTRGLAERDDAAENRRGFRPFPARLFAFTVAGVAIAAWFFGGAPRHTPDPAPFAPGQWAMPSDALLDLSRVPGSSVLGELDWAPPPPARDGASSTRPVELDLSAASAAPCIPSRERSFV